MGDIINPRQKILRFPRRIVPFKEGERGYPINVELDLANVCNLKCAHCDFAHVHDGCVLAPADAARVVEQLVAFGVLSLTITGGGEPTLAPSFVPTVRQASEAGLAVGVYTNGTHAQPLLDVVDRLTWVYISLDAVSPEDYARRKLASSRAGHHVFFDLLNLVTLLAATRRRAHPTVGLGFLVDGNWLPADLYDATRIAHDFGADYCQFRPVVGLKDYTWVPLLLPHLDRLASPSVLVSRERFVELHAFRRSYDLCLASELVTCVGADGTVWVCPNTRGLRPLGNLLSEEFAAIWERRPRQRVGPDCRVACRGHDLNETLNYICGEGPHDPFV